MEHTSQNIQQNAIKLLKEVNFKDKSLVYGYIREIATNNYDLNISITCRTYLCWKIIKKTFSSPKI